MAYETELWPFVKARHFTRTNGKRSVRVVVIHTMEAAEKGNTAEAVAGYFRTTTRPASAHVCVDNDSVVQCVKDNNVAYAAPGCNHDGIQVEMAGRAGQSAAEWDDEYSRAMLARAADVVAQYCLKYNIPCEHLSNAALKGGKRGIVGHDQVSKVYKRSTHTDPGKQFPWCEFIESVREYYEQRKQG